MASMEFNTQTGRGLFDLPILHGLSNITNAKGMKLLHQNICGLVAKTSHIEHILMNFKDIHMFTLSETHLNEENSPLLADISGFKLAYRNRPNGTYGGVAAFISDRVQWIRRHDLEHPELECLWIEVLIKNAKSILVGTIYKTPVGSKFLSKDFPDYFDDMLSTAAAENKELILMGDLNCNFLKKSSDADIKSIKDVNGLMQMVKDPTRITRESSTLIDVVCTNKPQNITRVDVIPACLSDHELIGCVRKLNSHSFKPCTIKTRDYKNYSQEDLCFDLRQLGFESVYSSITVE
jgi:exonuclease III